MIARLFRYLLIPFFALGGIISFTFNDLAFQLSDTRVLERTDMRNLADIHYNQHYRIDHPLLYKLPISNESDSKKATLLWPDEPFNKLAILVATQDESIDTQTQFAGRLVRCPGQCQAGEMIIDMIQFADKIAQWFPEYADHYSELPSVLMDTTERPGGWSAYFNHHKRIYQGWCALLIFSVVAAFSGSFMPQRFRFRTPGAAAATAPSVSERPHVSQAIPKQPDNEQSIHLDDA